MVKFYIIYFLHKNKKTFKKLTQQTTFELYKLTNDYKLYTLKHKQLTLTQQIETVIL